MRKPVISEAARQAPGAAARSAPLPSLAERVAVLDRLTAWPTLRLRCALRQPG